ncbi:MAG TPA: choice-of-anchor E domain-containing protein [Chitinophagaceae bacterium]|nr:choice-of-anchor E domain-containing protein [Chitinophagaceae bacterium]
MKNFYTKIFIFLCALVLQLSLPVALKAQCNCGSGIPATPIKQTITIAPTTISTLVFTFQQFNPAIGTLNCINVEDTITGYSYTGARNTGPDSTAFLFLLSLTNKVSGPGVNITHPFSKVYGYDTLAPYGIPGDSITYGPANIITNPTSGANIGGNAAYLGTGTVNYVYAINGGMITQDGGSNYNSSVSTTIGGTISLTYYYCPAVLLANGLRNFSAAKRNNLIQLKWEAQNAADIDLYHIEYSVDGTNYSPVAAIPGNHSALNSNYSYNYALNGSSSGFVYFRIKQTGADNKSAYSAVQKIKLDEQSAAGINIRPNPVTTGMSITFDHPLSGDYNIALVNLAGQVVVDKKMTLRNSSLVPVNWSNKPAPGVYFTRITNTSTREQQIIRVVIQ